MAIPPVVPTVVYVNVYEGEEACLHMAYTSLESADKCARANRVCVRVFVLGYVLYAKPEIE